jgi:secondary thiamine-phosphate synthase enzyme
MHVHENLNVSTKGQGFHDLTRAVRDVVSRSGATVGLCTVFVPHTSASLVIQENADPAVLRDLAQWLDRLAPEGPHYEHDAEGADDMPAHLKSVATRTSESIPILRSKLALGTWQAIYLIEHRRAPHERTVIVHVSGE